MAAYHNSNLGAFGASLIVDLDGYTYTTAHEWLTVARLDAVSQQELQANPEWASEWAEETAAAARKAVDAANAAAADWQRS